MVGIDDTKKMQLSYHNVFIEEGIIITEGYLATDPLLPSQIRSLLEPLKCIPKFISAKVTSLGMHTYCSSGQIFQ